MSDIRDLAHTSYDDLIRYIQGHLVSKRLSLIDRHLADCNICRERLSRSVGSQQALHLAGKAGTDQSRERSEPRFNTGSEAIVQELSPLSLDRHKVTIVDISANGLGIVGSNAAVPGTIIQVRINTTVELAEVRHCSAYDKNRYRIGLRFIGVRDERPRTGAMVGDWQIPLAQQPDRRQTPRQQLRQSTVVSLCGAGQVLQGEIRDLSKGGTRILLQEPLPISSMVKIEYADEILLGEVVYCRQEQAGWLVGIRVTDASPKVTDRKQRRVSLAFPRNRQ